MSRSGYSEDGDEWATIMWRGAVTSALRGKRGQGFLRETLAALDAPPKPELITNNLAVAGAFCTLGAVAAARGGAGLDVDPEDHEAVAAAFSIPHALACEIMYENDEGGPYYTGHETPRARWERMRRWIVANLRADQPSSPAPPLGSAREAAEGNLPPADPHLEPPTHPQAGKGEI